MQRIARSLRRYPLPALALPLAMIAMAMTLRGASEASDVRRWTAGERAAVESPASADLSRTIAGRATRVADAVGLGGAASRQIATVDDRFRGRTVHETTYLDARGRPIGVIRLTPAGALLSVVRLGYREDYASGSVSGGAAAATATALLAELGIEAPSDRPVVRPTMNGTLWTVSWTRSVDGVLVEGDGLTVRVWRSGALHSMSVSERPVLRAATTIGAEAARAVLDGLLPRLVTGARRGDGSLSSVGLRWVAANDRFRPDGADAPAAGLRLAYVFELRFGGPSAEVLRAATFWIDAETGELIGGDVLR